MRKLSSGLS